MNLRFTAALAAVVYIAGAAVADADSTAVPAKVSTKYNCQGDKVAVTYDNVHDKMYLHYAGERIILDRVSAADGARYVSTKKHVDWWEKGGVATLSSLLADNTTEDKKLATCTYRR